jgi:polyhydroxybutyrate depolymerase
MTRVVRTLTLLIVALGAPSLMAGTWVEDQVLLHDGLNRSYRYFIPDVQPPGGYPVLFLLHGGGGDMRNMLNNGTHAEWPFIADEAGVMLIVPNGVNRETGDPDGEDQAWNDCRSDVEIADTSADDVGFINALIDWADASYAIDLTRIYSTGSSNGGMMSFRLAFELDERIAAIAPFIANLPADDSECRKPSRAMPVFISNGDAEDNYMPWEGGCVVAASGTCRRGSVLSAEETRDFWIAHNQISSLPVETIDYPDLDPTDGATATSFRYEGGFEGTEVAFYRIRGGGHVGPTIAHPRSRLYLQLAGLGNQCEDIEGAREAWAFLSRFTLEGAGAGSLPGEAGLLRVTRGAGGQLDLRWAGDCGSAGRYVVYRGDLNVGLSSAAAEPGLCDVSETSAAINEGAGRADFFLVVPNDGAFEGSYGRDSAGALRPASGACYTPAPPDTCATH